VQQGRMTVGILYWMQPLVDDVQHDRVVGGMVRGGNEKGFKKEQKIRTLLQLSNLYQICSSLSVRLTGKMYS
jgi:hypothetical protein